MTEYPKLVACPFTGVIATVKDASEERSFKLAPLFGCAIAIAIIPIALALIIFSA